MDVSIVIPTKNAGILLRDVLKKIFEQKTQYTYEVIAVDSGSKDCTLNILKKHPVKVYKIKPEDFGHGKTRNYGASRGNGKFIVFLTQDALPKNEFWLEELVSACDLDKDIAGAFSRHIPYEGCNILDKRDITFHFNNFGEEILIQFLEDKERYQNDESYRHFLGFFSDNSSCLRREVWEKYPYKDVNFAEDQIWAKEIIENGYKKVYTPRSIVYHSHNYDLKTYFKRYFDEFKGIREVYNYKIVKNIFLIIPLYLKITINDLNYLKTLNYDAKTCKNCKNYIKKRNLYKVIGGYLGGNYLNFSKSIQKYLDKKISQQYEQKNS